MAQYKCAKKSEPIPVMKRSKRKKEKWIEASSHSDICSFHLSCNNAITFVFDMGWLKRFILITV